MTPSPSTVGQTVTFTGSGEDLDGSISAYEWSSNLTGVMGTSTSTTYSTSSLSAGTHAISLRVKDDDGAWSSPVTRSLTVNTSTSGTTENIYICIGYRIDWQWNAKAGLEYLLRTMGAQKVGDAWRYVNQTTKKEFFIRFVEDINSMKLALQEEGAHVLFQGHSNYGLGPVFATIEEVQNQYIEDIYWIDDPKIFNISSPWVAFSPKSMRTGHAFPDWWPEFQDGTSGIMPYDFSDPNVDPPHNYYITYRIPGDPNLYKVEAVNKGAIERFPDSGKPAWYSPDGRSPDPTNPAELQYFLTNLEPGAPPVKVMGEWTWSREVSGFFKENYFYLPAGTGQNKVEWLFTIQEPGDYKIFAWWPAASHHTTGASYTVNHSAGSSPFVVNQTQAGSQWNEFGQFYFVPGNYSIILSDEASSGRVVADGVKITALSGVLDKEIDNMIYPPPHYGKKTVMFRKDLDVQKESLRYRQLFYDSCNSGIYYLDTFNRGIAFFTLNDSSCLGFNAYVKAYLEGKSKEEIWRAMQDKSPIYDYYDFNKVPSEQ
ncbi:MAG: PKD domain-containing protein [Methanoregula sp.]|nr:PKD domain-containing protein [Methanoregula sp.]